MKTGLLYLISFLVFSAAVFATEDIDPFRELFTDGLIDADGNVVSLDHLKGKIVGIYFSAHWCPPCRAFTPKLVEFRDKNSARFEVVFVSSDRSKAEKIKYMKESKMKWPSVEFGVQSVGALKKKYKIRGIPSLVILGTDGKTITENGRADVSKDAENCLATWQKEAGIIPPTEVEGQK